MARRLTTRLRQRSAMTLVELLAAMAVFSVIFMILWPAIHQCREGARRVQCANHLVQIATGVHHYYHAYQVYPPGVSDAKGPVRNWPQGRHHGWLTRILPYVEGRSNYRHVDFSVSAYHRNNARVRSVRYIVSDCPSSDYYSMATPYPGLQTYPTTYAGVHHDLDSDIDVDNHGNFFLNSVLRRRDLRDGAGQTLMVGEKIIDSNDDLGWMSGTRATLRNTGVGLNISGFDAAGRMVQPWRNLSKNSNSFDDQGNFMIGLPPRSSNDGSTGDGSTRRNPPSGLVQGGGFYVGGFSSAHSSGVQFAFADGRVAFVEEQIELRVLQQLAHRSDGGLLDPKNVLSDW